MLDQVSSLAPGVRAAALAGPAGMVQMRSGGPFNETALAADASGQADIHANAPMLVTQTLRDGDGKTALVALASRALFPHASRTDNSTAAQAA